MGDPETFRPHSAYWGLGTGVVVATLMVAGLLGGRSSPLTFAWPLLVGFAAWLFFWSPYLRVDDAGVTVRNVLRTVRLPWLTLVRVETRFALTLHTSDAECQVWVAPAGGRYASRREGPGPVPVSMYGPAGARPSDSLGSASGEAAYLVRRRWNELREAGHLDGGPEPGRDRATIRWHLVELAVAAVLLVAAAATLV